MSKNKTRFRQGLLSLACVAAFSFAVSVQTKAVTAPTFSQESGSYDKAFSLTLKAGAGEKIYYTTNGDEPTTASTPYTNGIQVKSREGEANVIATKKNLDLVVDNNSLTCKVPGNDIAKCTVIRAISVDAAGAVSKVITKTYFVGMDLPKKYPGAAVLSLVTDNKNLFDYETGIYVRGKVYDDNLATNQQLINSFQWWKLIGNYTQKGKEWERASHIDLFETDGTFAASKDLGIRGHGGASRMYAQKSFNFYVKKAYSDDKTFEYELFPGKKNAKGEKVTSFQKFMLRNGGNDTEYTKLGDVFCQNLVRDRAFGTQASRPCVVFLNGEYWGLYNLQEKYSDYSLSTEYGVDPKNVVSFKEGELDEGEETDQPLYDEFVALASLDMTKAENYKKFTDLVDLQCFIDYFATEIFIGNNDWPAENAGLPKNMQIWRTRTVEEGNPYADTKWRYLLFDTEYSFGLYNSDIGDAIEHARKDKLFKAVSQNPDFQKAFANTFCDLAAKNFKVANMQANLDSLISLYQPLMADFYSRFRLGDYNFEQRTYGIETSMKTRSAAVRSSITSKFKAGDKTTVRIMSSAANAVDINTITADLSKNETYPDCKADNWFGVYFKKYGVKVSAKDVAGRKFVKWVVTTGADLKKLDQGAETFTVLETNENKTCELDLSKAGAMVNIIAVYDNDPLDPSNTVSSPTPEPQATEAPTAQTPGSNDTPGSVDTSTNPTTTVSAPAKVSKVTLSTTKKTLKIKWKKVAGAKGYKILVSKDKKFKKGVKSYTVKTTSKTVKKLKSKTKYFVKVCAYTLDGSKKVYGKYSSVANKKIK